MATAEATTNRNMKYEIGNMVRAAKTHISYCIFHIAKNGATS